MIGNRNHLKYPTLVSSQTYLTDETNLARRETPYRESPEKGDPRLTEGSPVPTRVPQKSGSPRLDGVPRLVDEVLETPRKT